MRVGLLIILCIDLMQQYIQITNINIYKSKIILPALEWSLYPKYEVFKLSNPSLCSSS